MRQNARRIAVMLGRLAAGAALCAACASCGTRFAYVPVARIAVTPGFVPQGDDFATTVTLDGRGSSDPIDAPDAGDTDLAFAWSLAGDTVRVTQGTLTGPLLAVRVAGARTVQVTLTVTNPQGASSTAEATIGLTVPAPDGGGAG